MDTITIYLDLPAEERWAFASAYRNDINQLIECYLKDIDDYEALFYEMKDAYKAAFLPSDYLQEIAALAHCCDYNADQVLFANLYYDVVKYAFACTAYATWDGETVWHARNLDWWTDNDALKKYTKIFNYTKGGQTVFQSVGWVGFVGVLSGFKPGQFAVTLNAIISEAAPQMARPITFLLREILEGDYRFDTAQKVLKDTEIVCDCLLLLSGTQADELVVIERMPSQSATRTVDGGSIVVTNDYHLLHEWAVDQGNVLGTTSCGRFERAAHLLRQQPPQTADACYRILNDSAVKMGITVQQMVFNTKKNQLVVF